MIFNPCDILFTRSKSVMGSLIRFLTRQALESKTIASHVGIITGLGDRNTAIVVEAQAHCNRHLFGRAYPIESATELCIFRPTNLTEQEKNSIVKKAESYVGRDYGYFKLILHMLDWTIGGVYLFRRLGRMDKYPICSYVVSSAFESAGKDFGISKYGASPDDMWDFVTSNPSKYQFIWQNGKMVK